MDDIEAPLPSAESNSPGWASDVAAEMLRHLGIKWVALNPGASYRGLHDSLVNHLGNRDPQMLLCLNEDHVISIPHGYAKVMDEPMACVLHSNVGLMHGLMGVFNAWCDRMPMLILGATGPVAPDKRRPWIDWIHTSKDQGALLRGFTKWDDEPRSAPGIIEGMLRAHQATTSLPRAPVYVCLDAGLQEQALEAPLPIPDVARYRAPPPPAAPAESMAELAGMIGTARRPLFLFGRGSRSQAHWDARVALAERAGASVMTSMRERSIFPTEHPLHVAAPFYWLSPAAKERVREADLIVSFDWTDLNGFLQQLQWRTGDYPARIAHITLDRALHNGWSMDHFGLPPVDLPIAADADTVVAQLLAALPAESRWDGTPHRPPEPIGYSAGAAERIAPRDVEVALARAREGRDITLAHATIGWAGDAFAFRGPLDFLGHDGGAGLAAGPGLTIGAGLALRGSGRLVVGVLGDGDFLQGVTALWTAAHYQIPAVFIISNNRSNFNDEIHQEAVAKIRGRPTENRWIGQRIDGPHVDLAGMARAQGVEAEGPVTTVPELEAAIARGLAAVAAGKPYLIDALVVPGYSSPPLTRGE